MTSTTTERPDPIEALERVKESILKNPSRFHMGSWVGKRLPKRAGGPCQTTMCIAGWLVHNEVPEIDVNAFEGRALEDQELYNYCNDFLAILAADILDQDVKAFRSDDLPWVFHVSQWPYDLALERQTAETVEEELKVTCKAIDLYILELRAERATCAIKQ